MQAKDDLYIIFPNLSSPYLSLILLFLIIINYSIFQEKQRLFHRPIQTIINVVMKVWRERLIVTLEKMYYLKI